MIFQAWCTLDPDVLKIDIDRCDAAPGPRPRAHKPKIIIEVNQYIHRLVVATGPSTDPVRNGTSMNPLPSFSKKAWLTQNPDVHLEIFRRLRLPSRHAASRDKEKAYSLIQMDCLPRLCQTGLG